MNLENRKQCMPVFKFTNMMVPERLCGYFKVRIYIIIIQEQKTHLYLTRVKLELSNLWQFNHLPAEIKMLNTLNAFKNKAREYLLSF